MKSSISKKWITVSLVTLLLVSAGIALADEQGQTPPSVESAAPSSTTAPPAAPASPSTTRPGETAVAQPTVVPPPTTGPATPLPAQDKKPDTSLPQALQLSPAITRIGVIDMSRIDRESKLGKDAQAKLKAKKEKLQAQLTAKQKQLEKQKAEIEKTLPNLSPAERAKKGKEFEKKVEEYRKLIQKSENDMKPLVEELARSLSSSIKEAAATYGKANGLTAIVSMRELIYVSSSAFPEDVTDGVLQQLNGSGAKP